ncbi:hypothetical protein EI546_13345 [Aequorivita sp. H23M31]|uniref:Uncharacterized protein n=1 Tax=Aequorivita ciconiae TaxID=2494375 RepID=A0A410G5U4_9FLAO|nr:hypothetical protein [Aequorivita sp. H23M31]QAA82642.1 hypothetical protein EI546_13345 [Aequorivita sp. H23M31]
MKRQVYDVLFIIGMAVIMIIMVKVLSPNVYIAFSFLPVLTAYWVGQLVQRKFGKTEENE